MLFVTKTILLLPPRLRGESSKRLKVSLGSRVSDNYWGLNLRDIISSFEFGQGWEISSLKSWQKRVLVARLIFEKALNSYEITIQINILWEYK